MKFFQFLAWAIVHIGLPIFAPIALLPLLGVGKTYREKAKGIAHNAYSAVLVMLGAIDALNPRPREAGTEPIMVISICLTALSASIFGAGHFLIAY